MITDKAKIKWTKEKQSDFITARCPKCYKRISVRFIGEVPKECNSCGQNLSWNEEDKRRFKLE